MFDKKDWTKQNWEKFENTSWDPDEKEELEEFACAMAIPSSMAEVVPTTFLNLSKKINNLEGWSKTYLENLIKIQTEVLQFLKNKHSLQLPNTIWCSGKSRKI